MRRPCPTSISTVFSSSEVISWIEFKNGSFGVCRFEQASAGSRVVHDQVP
jgi:hypothetical protein